MRFTNRVAEAAVIQLPAERIVTIPRLSCVLLLCLLACVPTAAQTTEALDAELANTRAAIAEAEAENANYAGGLVKSLIVSRIETLKQTEAMLNQRRAAKSVGVTLRYTIDGKPFTLPAGAKEQLPSIEREIQANNVKIAAAENEVSRYSGGLVLAMAMSTLATLRQTAAMLDQRRLSIQFELPQYIGSQPAASTSGANAAGNENTLPSRGAFQRTPDQAPEEKAFEITDVASQVTEQNTTWWKFAWRVSVRNLTNNTIVVRATIEWLNASDFIVDDNDSDATPIRPGETATLTGYDLVTANVAGSITKTGAKVRRVQ